MEIDLIIFLLIFFRLAYFLTYKKQKVSGNYNRYSVAPCELNWTFELT